VGKTEKYMNPIEYPVNVDSLESPKKTGHDKP
jgi:hypothetical protein